MYRMCPVNIVRNTVTYSTVAGASNIYIHFTCGFVFANAFCKRFVSASFRSDSEHVLLMTQELGLDPQAGYHAVELLQR